VPKGKAHELNTFTSTLSPTHVGTRKVSSASFNFVQLEILVFFFVVDEKSVPNVTEQQQEGGDIDTGRINFK